MRRENTVWLMLLELAKTKGLNEIVINGPKSVWAERQGQFVQLNYQHSEEHIQAFIIDVCKFNSCPPPPETTMIDGTLPDGSRINIVTPPYAYPYPAITIRHLLTDVTLLSDLPDLAWGLNSYWRQFLRAAVKGGCSIAVTGATSAGKTSFLNTLLQEIDLTERLICLEDTLELQIPHPNSVRLTWSLQGTKQQRSMRELVKNSLRMRPDRILVGEVRGAEVFDLLLALNTGHDGSMFTLHANSSLEALSRLEVLFSLAESDLPSKAIREVIARAVDYVIHLQRLRSGNRVVSQVLELTGKMEGDKILTQLVGQYQEEKTAVEQTRVSFYHVAKLQRGGWRV